MPHGFFAQMGGFVERSKDGSTRILLPDDLFSWMFTHKRVPKITTRQISGRSKGDSFSKVVIIFQTSWFIAQCVGRYVEGLFITSAELSTLAYAVLNGVMYILWWHKPLDCRTPVELHLSYSESYSYYITYPHVGSQVLPTSFAPYDPEFGNIDSNATPGLEVVVGPTQSKPEGHGIMPETTSLICNTNKNPFIFVPNGTRRILREVLFFPYVRLSSMRLSRIRDESVDQALMFHAYNPPKPGLDDIRKDMFWGHVLLVLVCLIFGGVHLLAWFSNFPSYTEHLLWRICGVAITVLPMIYGFPVLILRVALRPGPSGRRDTQSVQIAKRMVALINPIQLAIPPLYFIARLFLLIEMMISFRNLPSSAFVNVSWTTYFPHV
ncbi:hypothetical protein D9613_008814 [Agrocybe pediades]|uniref:Uncharacterized protein n=1 Tax=Agrocybe pediades TaxID=84607 RepID=A0A8H4QT06_9AGAR|nr:hypothetical protein D9613_008814 [Agrocybe pediades]